MIRIINIILVASAVCFGLFVFMASLIKAKNSPTITDKTSYVIEFVEPPKDSKVREKPPLAPPPKPQMPDLVKTNVSPVDGEGEDIHIIVPDIGTTGTDLDIVDVLGSADNDARPMVRVAPKYPIVAARDGKEGWVQLSFSITETGGVSDVQVLASEPKRVFDKEAIRALKKWKYKAKLVSGKAVKQENLTIQLEFKLDQANG